MCARPPGHDHPASAGPRPRRPAASPRAPAGPRPPAPRLGRPTTATPRGLAARAPPDRDQTPRPGGPPPRYSRVAPHARQPPQRVLRIGSSPAARETAPARGRDRPARCECRRSAAPLARLTPARNGTYGGAMPPAAESTEGAGAEPLSGAAIVAFVGTTDLDRAHAFYGGVLGLRRTEASPFANAYDVRGTSLRVTRVDRVAASAYTVLGWQVDDIAAAIAALAAREVPMKRFDGVLQDDTGVWTAPGGARIAWFEDPDANLLSLT